MSMVISRREEKVHGRIQNLVIVRQEEKPNRWSQFKQAMVGIFQQPTSKEEKSELEQLYQEMERLENQLVGLDMQLEQVRDQIAYRECPWQIGQLIRTYRGLGVYGAMIEKIVAPSKFSRHHNKWMLICRKLSVNGGFTKRVFTIQEEQGIKIVEIR